MKRERSTEQEAAAWERSGEWAQQAAHSPLQPNILLIALLIRTLLSIVILQASYFTLHLPCYFFKRGLTLIFLPNSTRYSRHDAF